jgi:hypothetical protein
MAGLSDLDQLVTKIAMTTYESTPVADWSRAKLVAKYAPSGVGAFEFAYTDTANHVEEGESPDAESICKLSDFTHGHWQMNQDLGQPRWYKMIVTVERSGKFNVEFEYKDDYQEGDIMKRG